jgi:hypothetical protein
MHWAHCRRKGLMASLGSLLGLLGLHGLHGLGNVPCLPRPHIPWCPNPGLSGLLRAVVDADTRETPVHELGCPPCGKRLFPDSGLLRHCGLRGLHGLHGLGCHCRRNSRGS